jgi:DNA-binding beta-propeller fold protein YncE
MRPSRVSHRVAGRTLIRILVGMTRCGVREGPARVARIAFVVCAVTLTLGATTGSAQASLLSAATTFGSQGSGAGQLSAPVGVAVRAQNGTVYVADSGNARVDEFGPSGNFIAAFGWGVADGKAQSEVCTSSCQAGIPGSGPGQFSNPTSIAVGVSGGPSAGKVFVGDAGNNVVEKFDASGSFISTIDGTTTPQGHFQSLAAIAVDQSGNLWTADAGTSNIDEFNAKGAFVRQWTDTHGPPSAIAVDSTNGAVYVMISFPSAPAAVASSGAPITERWTLTGQPKGQVDRPTFLALSRGFGSALALDPATGNLYVDHNGSGLADVAVYDRDGVQVDDLSLPSTSNSEGLAFRPSGSGNPAGKQNLYLSDVSASNMTIYVPQTKAGAPLVNSESVAQTGTTTATLAAGIVPLGNDTTCTFQFVDNADFQASGYSNATSVACTPADLGSGFTYQAPSADLSGLTTGTIYHFRVVATSSAGTSTGADQEFQAGPGVWASFFRCPVDDPAMLATNGDFSTLGLAFCLGSNSTHGSITLGNITTTTGNTNLQTGLIDANGTFAVIPASGGSPGGSLIADPVQLSTPVGPVTAITESAGAPSNFDLIAGISIGTPIITVPIKIHLANNPTLGPSCFIGSEQNPILLNPQNNDLSNALSVGGFFSFDPNGVPDVTGPDGALLITGLVQGDDTFAVPGATGCGPGGSLDAVVDAVAGLPSPSGSNHLVLDDASSSLAFPQNMENGQAFANDWHIAFGP